MSLRGLLSGARPKGEQTVPSALFGSWRRNWIQFGDGERETEVQVRWLQTASGTGDVRVDPQQMPHEADSSCGITVVDQSTRPYMTADWHDGATGFSQQAVSSFPEKGWLVWDSPSIMRELAPSGAYVEEWERLPDSVGPVAHFVAPDAPTVTNLYVAGNQIFLAEQSTLAGGLHRFTCGAYVAATDAIIIELSSVPSQLGEPLDFGDTTWRLVSYRDA